MAYVEDRYTHPKGASTFLIRIHFKQNTNWQGTIQWLESNQTIPFRSVLELVFLLNEAVDKTPIYGELDLCSWRKKASEDFNSKD